MKPRTWWAVLTGTRWFAARPADDAARRGAIDAMYARYRQAFPDVPECDPTALRDALAAGDPPVIVDVREPAEQAVSRIPGALTTAEFEARPELHDRPVVAYCTIGARSGEYAGALRSRGIDARNLAGSLLAWTHVGGPLVDDDGPTRRVHVYGPKWDLAADGYEGIH